MKNTFQKMDNVVEILEKHKQNMQDICYMEIYDALRKVNQNNSGLYKANIVSCNAQEDEEVEIINLIVYIKLTDNEADFIRRQIDRYGSCIFIKHETNATERGQYLKININNNEFNRSTLGVVDDKYAIVKITKYQ